MHLPVYVFSDSHMGAGRPGGEGQAQARDNFEAWGHDRDLPDCLDYVDGRHSGGASIVITGDLFEFWQAAVGDVLVARKGLLARLAAFGRGDRDRLRYIPGNHDIDLQALISQSPGQDNEWLRHPFFRHLEQPFTEKIGDRHYHFLHGHEGDGFNKGSFPGFGRVMAVLAAMVEDLAGSPYFDQARKISVEGSLSALADKVLGFWDWLGRGLVQRQSAGQGGAAGGPLRGVEAPGGTGGFSANLLAKEARFFEAPENETGTLAREYLGSAWLEYLSHERNREALRSAQTGAFQKRGSGAMVRENIGQLAQIRSGPGWTMSRL
ncbi:MAG: hypothetical protein LBP33_06160 [Candidatus Adiutrix sp.]|jgi:UDP-2,3-diacylglucosamine pyrophosphatase LpxH|nr:hypothetical protein [Candidatus Adiutrix sp.]